MGTGIIAFLKDMVPLGLYLGGVLFCFLALIGKIRWTLLLVIFLLPLRNVIDRLQDFPQGDQFLDILIIAMLIGWCVTNLGRRRKFLEKSTLNFGAILVILYTLISLEWGNHYLGASMMLNIGDPRVQDWKNYCLLPIIFFLTLNNIKDQKWVERVFIVMCLAMAIMDYYTTTQISWFSSLVSRTKITGTFQFLGPNEVAAFYSQYTIILMSVYFAMRMGLKKILLLGLILLNFYCLMFMYSRAAYFAITVGLFLLFAIKKRILLLPLFLVAFFWQLALPQQVIERIEETTNEYGELDISAEKRLTVWSEGMHLFKDTPLLGVGFGVFRRLGFDLGDTHNIYVKTLVEQGLIGFLIFLILIFSFAIEGFKLYLKGEDDLSKGLGLGLVICMFVLMVNNIFGDRWSYLELSAYLWIYAALVSRLNAIAESAPSEKIPLKKTGKLRQSFGKYPRSIKVS